MTKNSSAACFVLWNLYKKKNPILVHSGQNFSFKISFWGSQNSPFEKYISKLKKFWKRLKSINFHHNMWIILCSFIDAFRTRGYVYIFAAQDSLIKPFFHSFELVSESCAIKSHLILTESKWVLSKGMSEGAFIEPSGYKIQRLCSSLKYTLKSAWRCNEQ